MSGATRAARWSVLAGCVIFTSSLHAQQCQPTAFRGVYNSWNVVHLTASGFPSSLGSALSSAMPNATNQWNSTCFGSGIPTMTLTQPPSTQSYTRFNIQYVGGTYPDPGRYYICGRFISTVAAEVYAFMNTPNGPASCNLDNPSRLAHIIAHEIGHRFGLADLSGSCDGHAMSDLPQFGEDSSLVQGSECEKADSLNSTATERNVCDDLTDCRSSPILVSCRGKWSLTSLADGVWFDFDGDGAETHTAWTAAGSELAFLFADINGTGCVENGAELFGDNSPLASGSLASNGFEALSERDSDGDGLITPGDSIWPSLRLWTDGSHDGRCDTGEVASLASAGVWAIATEYRWVGRRDRHGNEFRYAATAWCGEEGGVIRPRRTYDVFFVTEGAH